MPMTMPLLSGIEAKDHTRFILSAMYTNYRFTVRIGDGLGGR